MLEKKILVIYISNTLSVGEFYNVLSDLYFSIVNDQTLDIELPVILNNTQKYISEINSLNKEVENLKERLNAINLINNAKRLLANKGYSEADSHQFIQRNAMDLRLSKKMVATLIIKNKIDF